MKIKNMLVLGASAVIVTAGVNAAEPVITTSPGSTTVQIPQGRTVIEAAPGSTVEVTPHTTVVETAPGATIVEEPAGAPHWNDRFRYDRDADKVALYPDHEFTVDLFAAYAKGKRKFNDTFDTSMRHGKWGAGVGVNYFFTKCFGIGADAFGLDNDGGLVDAANASVIFRLPIDVAHLAPYAFGGGGRQFEGSDTWTAHVGAGLEVRLNSHTGFFLDGRHVFTDKGPDYALLRSGLRLAF